MATYDINHPRYFSDENLAQLGNQRKHPTMRVLDDHDGYEQHEASGAATAYDYAPGPNETFDAASKDKGLLKRLAAQGGSLPSITFTPEEDGGMPFLPGMQAPPPQFAPAQAPPNPYASFSGAPGQAPEANPMVSQLADQVLQEVMRKLGGM